LRPVDGGQAIVVGAEQIIEHFDHLVAGIQVAGAEVVDGHPARFTVIIGAGAVNLVYL